MPPVATLIQQSQLKQRPDISRITRQSNEKRHISSIILRTLTIGVKVNRPIIPADGERLGGNVFPNSHAFRQRIAFDLEIVRPIYCLRPAGGCGGGGLSRRRRFRLLRIQTNPKSAHVWGFGGDGLRSNWGWGAEQAMGGAYAEQGTVSAEQAATLAEQAMAVGAATAVEAMVGDDWRKA
nr:hypothetical protein KK1_010315 [Ipomoea batatas]